MLIARVPGPEEHSCEVSDYHHSHQPERDGETLSHDGS